MVSDFDFLSAVFATPPGSPLINREWGYYKLRIASPHHSPAVAAALPEQAHAAGAPPKSLGGREKVPLSSVSLSRPACHRKVNGLRGSLGQQDSSPPLLSVIAPPHLPLGTQNEVPVIAYMKLSRNSRGYGG